MPKLRILLADDHAVLRAGLKMLINTQADMGVAGEAGSGRETIEQTAACRPDIVLMDISMPGQSGVETTERIREAYPHVRVLALTRHGDRGYLHRMLRAGASGYILKKTAADALINAIRVVAAGGIYVDPSLAGDLVESLVGQVPAVAATRPPRGLSEREAEVLHLIAWGYSNKEIAYQLGISVKTVEYHKANATEKIHLYSRTEILRYALAQGWLEEDDEPGPL